MVAKIDIPRERLTICDFGNKHTIWGAFVRTSTW